VAEAIWTAWRPGDLDSAAVANAILTRAEARALAHISVAQPGGAFASVAAGPVAVRGAVNRVWVAGGRVEARLGSSELVVRRSDGAAGPGIDLRFVDDAPDEAELLRWLQHLGIMLALAARSNIVTAFARDAGAPEPRGARRELRGPWSVWNDLELTEAEAWLRSAKAVSVGWLAPLVREPTARRAHEPSPPPPPRPVRAPSYLLPLTAAAPGAEPEDGPDETAALDLSVLRAGLDTPVTPFVEVTSPPARPPRLTTPAEAERQRGGDETMALPRGAVVPVSDDPLPVGAVVAEGTVIVGG
jgi:hypothetical protein